MQIKEIDSHTIDAIALCDALITFIARSGIYSDDALRIAAEHLSNNPHSDNKHENEFIVHAIAFLIKR